MRVVLTVLVAGIVAAMPAAAESWEQTSNNGEFVGTLAPVDGFVKVGKLQSWTLEVRTANGSPVTDARVLVGGGMPGHGHGLPTQPQIGAQFREGRYRIDGVKLSMAGSWVLAFKIDTASTSDVLEFSLELDAWSKDQRLAIASLHLSSNLAPPPSPSNRFADDPNAARLGKKLFFDRRFSANGELSCASCHQPDRAFTDNLPRGFGVERAGRNTPTVIGAAFQSWFYWDGRRDSLWAQALVPFEAANEMGSSRTAVVRLVGSDAELRADYESAFGTFPERLLSDEIPAHAGPLAAKHARDTWFTVSTKDAALINRVFANVGKAIAAYERTLPIPANTRFDKFAEAVMAGEARADKLLTDDELAGLRLFVDDEKTHCLRCHNGAWMTNGEFHNIGTGNFTGPELDFGRVYGLRSLLMDEFNCLGDYSDAPKNACTALRFLNQNSHVPIEGAFKVPGLRNVSATAPYMHDGSIASIGEVIDFYRNAYASQGGHELPPLNLTDTEARQLEAFLGTLSAEF